MVLRLIGRLFREIVTQYNDDVFIDRVSTLSDDPRIERTAPVDYYGPRRRYCVYLEEPTDRRTLLGIVEERGFRKPDKLKFVYG